VVLGDPHRPEPKLLGPGDLLEDSGPPPSQATGLGVDTTKVVVEPEGQVRHDPIMPS
jgi:hypothetical protein